VVVVQGPGIARERRALARLERRLERLPGTAQVLGPSDQPLAQPLGATLAENGDAARLAIVFDSDPLGGLAVNQLRRLEAAMPRLLRDSGLASARASFAGDTALVAETAADTLDDLTRVAPAALLVIHQILVAFLRALVAPLYLLASSTLAVLASLGITTYFFQDILGQVDVTYYVPFAAAVLLLALGSDYNVFLVGRVWQEARDRPLREALEVAGARSAKPIAVAGVVLALSFAALALVPVRPFRELAFTMAVGLLLDAFLVRTLLVPALIRLVGERSGWPGRALAPARQRAAPATRT
jgi:RND superfamily putative drug exporter